MGVQWVTQLEFLLRLVVAGLCGGLIGYERKNRLKEAGIRTHLIVALGAALIMIISKY
ncbi:MAG: MgtC/SapB family protein, partial [Clostridia bacterium]|nr:MgtC/SapB family protein [Clostridia bacterium]